VTTATSKISGHGVALGRLRGPTGCRPGPDEDDLTMAVEAAQWALHRAGSPAIERIVAAVPRTAVNDDAVLVAALRLLDDVPVLRIDRALDGVELAGGLGGHTLVLSSQAAGAAAVVLADGGYAEISKVRRAVGGAAIADGSRDPRFARHAGMRALARELGGAAPTGDGLTALAEVLDRGDSGTVTEGTESAVVAVDVSVCGPIPPGPSRSKWEAAAHEPSAAEDRGAGGSRPRGATGVDPDGALLWRERRELLVPQGARCDACGAVNVPPAGGVLCRRCGHRRLELVDLPRRGTVATFCVSTSLPRALPGPLALIYADLQDGTRWKAMGSGIRTGDLSIGDPVELVLRRLGLDDGAPIYGLAFRRPLA
jgi:uncharacterized OB-fold protein